MFLCLGEFVADFVVVAAGRVAGDQLAQEAREKELRAQNHRRQGQVEVGRVGHQRVVVARMHVVELERPYHNHRDEAQQEHQASQQAKEMHRLDTKLCLEPQREQVKIAVDKAV